MFLVINVGVVGDLGKHQAQVTDPVAAEMVKCVCRPAGKACQDVQFVYEML